MRELRVAAAPPRTARPARGGGPAAVPAPPRWRAAARRLPPPAWALLGYTAAAALLTLPGWASGAPAGAGGDQVQAAWFLAWTPHALGAGQDPLISHALNAPDGVNLMWNTSLLLPALLLWPVTAALGAFASYNALMTAALATSAGAGFVAARHLGAAPWPSALAGLVYGFGPYMTAHLLGGHPNLVLAAGPPLLLVLLDDVLVRQRRSPLRSGTLLGLLCAAQLVTGEEILASELIAAGLGVAILCALHRDRVRRRAGHAARALAVGLAVAAPLVAVPLAVQFLGPQRAGGPIHRPGFFGTDLANLVAPTWMQQLNAGGWALAGNASPFEADGYLGLPLLAGAYLAVRRRRHQPAVRFVALLGAALALLSLGSTLRVAGHDTGVPLPWRLVDAVPVLGSLLPNRLMLYVDLCAAVLLALAVGDLARRPGRSRAAAAGLAGLAVATLLPTVPLPASVPQTPPFFTSPGAPAALRPGATVLVVPMASVGDGGAGAERTVAMAWQLAAGFRFAMPGGYFVGPGDGAAPVAAAPTTTSRTLAAVLVGEPAPAVTPELRRAVGDDLARWRADAVVVGPMPHRDRAVALLTQLLGRPPLEVGGVELWTGATVPGA